MGIVSKGHLPLYTRHSPENSVWTREAQELSRRADAKRPGARVASRCLVGMKGSSMADATEAVPIVTWNHATETVWSCEENTGNTVWLYSVYKKWIKMIHMYDMKWHANKRWDKYGPMAVPTGLTLEGILYSCQPVEAPFKLCDWGLYRGTLRTHNITRHKSRFQPFNLCGVDWFGFVWILVPHLFQYWEHGDKASNLELCTKFSDKPTWITTDYTAVTGGVHRHSQTRIPILIAFTRALCCWKIFLFSFWQAGGIIFLRIT